MTWGAVGVAAVGAYMSYESQQQQAQAQAAANRANMGLAQQGFAQTDEQFAQSAAISNEQSLSRRAREDQINQYQQQQFGEYRSSYLDPYSDVGQQALTQQQALLGLSGKQAGREAMESFSETPGQVFLRDQQEKARLRNASATGALRGGNTQRALQEDAAGRASTNFDNYYSKLGALSGQGLSAGLNSRGPGYIQTGADQGISATGGNLVKDRKAEAAAQRASSERISAQNLEAARLRSINKRRASSSGGGSSRDSGRDNDYTPSSFSASDKARASGRY